MNMHSLDRGEEEGSQKLPHPKSITQMTAHVSLKSIEGRPAGRPARLLVGMRSADADRICMSTFAETPQARPSSNQQA